MTLFEAIRLIEGIADEGAEVYQEDYDNGRVDEALRKIDEFLVDIGGE